MSDLTNKANTAAQPYTIKEGVFALRDALLDTQGYDQLKYRQANMSVRACVENDINCLNLTLFQRVAERVESIVVRSDAQIDKAHEIVEIPEDDLSYLFEGEVYGSAPKSLAKLAKQYMQSLGLLNEQTGNWELSMARMAMIEKHQDIAVEIPADLEARTSITALSEYVGKGADIVDRLDKSIVSKMTGHPRPATAVEQELGLAGTSEDNFKIYYNAELDKAYSRNNDISFEEKDQRVKELRALAEQNHGEVMQYNFLRFDMGNPDIPQPELGIDLVFDEMFTEIMVAQEEITNKVYAARDELVMRLETILDSSHTDTTPQIAIEAP